MEYYLIDHLPTPMLLDHDSILTMINQTNHTLTQNIFHFLAYDEWRTISTHTQ